VNFAIRSALEEVTLSELSTFSEFPLPKPVVGDADKLTQQDTYKNTGVH